MNHHGAGQTRRFLEELLVLTQRGTRSSFRNFWSTGLAALRCIGITVTFVNQPESGQGEMLVDVFDGGGFR